MPRFKSPFLTNPPPREFVVAAVRRLLEKLDEREAKERRLAKMFAPEENPDDNPPPRKFQNPPVGYHK